MALKSGDLIGGKYRIGQLIGEGGMGRVYEARHEALGLPIALKVLHEDLSERPGLTVRFLQEARACALIQSPHVTRVMDVDQLPEGLPYMVMERLTGESLQALLDRERRLPVDQAVDYALQILSGLESAHAAGVIHRDLKPDNVFITPSTGGPVIKLLDFGIAKLRQTSEYQQDLTRPGALMGTPEYMAPEQLYAADQVDARADLYSVGAMLYEMLSGHRPADGQEPAAIVAIVATGQVKPLRELAPHVPQALADLVHRAMAPDREHRFPSAMDLRLSLSAFAGSLSHAGRLAATPAPAAVIPAPTAQASTTLEPNTTRAVPPTLPPDDEPPGDHRGGAGTPAKDATQEAPREMIERMTAERAARAAPAPAPPSMVTAQGARRRRSPWGVVFGVLVALGATAGIVALIIWQRESRDTSAPPLPTLSPDAPAPPTTITAQPGTPPLAPSPPVTTPTPAPAPRAPTTPAKPPPAPTATAPATGDAGAPDAAAPPAFPPLTLPSSLPPLPSGLPPLPSGFPTTLPTAFPSTLPPIPGFPAPAPAPSAPPPGG